MAVIDPDLIRYCGGCGWATTCTVPPKCRRTSPWEVIPSDTEAGCPEFVSKREGNFYVGVINQGFAVEASIDAITEAIHDLRGFLQRSR